jgi:hypothetical protein
MGATWNSRRGELEAEVDANEDAHADAREGVIPTTRAIGSAEGTAFAKLKSRSPGAPRARK